jgi:predicted HicB family RNase H-like nuclease
MRKINYSKKFSLRLDEKNIAEIKKMARKLKITASEMVRIILIDYLNHND